MDEKLAVVNDVIFGNLANFWKPLVLNSGTNSSVVDRCVL